MLSISEICGVTQRAKVLTSAKPPIIRQRLRCSAGSSVASVRVLTVKTSSCQEIRIAGATTSPKSNIAFLPTGSSLACAGVARLHRPFHQAGKPSPFLRYRELLGSEEENGR